MHVLDAGCGTGNYSKALLDKGVGRVTMIDGSEGMLSKAKRKMEPYCKGGSVVDIKLHKLPSLPFEDGQFDAVMFNHVLHHLDKTNTKEKMISESNRILCNSSENIKNDESNGDEMLLYPNASEAIFESKRVLKKNGVLFALTMSPVQVSEAVWYHRLMPDVSYRYGNKFPPISTLEEIMENVRMSDVTTLAILNSVEYSWEHFKHLDGPFCEEWRNCDSFFSLATNEELGKGLEWLKDMKHDGTLKEFFQQGENKRHELGSHTLLVAIKK